MVLSTGGVVFSVQGLACLMNNRDTLPERLNALRSYFERNPTPFTNDKTLELTRELLSDYDRLRRGMMDVILTLDADNINVVSLEHKLGDLLWK